MILAVLVLSWFLHINPTLTDSDFESVFLQPSCPYRNWNSSICSCIGQEPIGKHFGPNIMCQNVGYPDQLTDTFRNLGEELLMYQFKLQNSNLTSLPPNPFGNSSFVHFSLLRIQITSIPEDFFRSSEDTVEMLTVAWTNITSFPFKALNGFPKLEGLILHDNHIEVVPTGAFGDIGLPALKVLFLNANKITSIGENAFSRLISLKILDLADNPLVTLGDRSLVMNAIPGPLMIDLTRNKINTIAVSAITGVKKGFLQLINNSLTILDENVFMPLIKNETISTINGNELDCEHPQMAWIKKLSILSMVMLNGLRCKHHLLLDELPIATVLNDPPSATSAKTAESSSIINDVTVDNGKVDDITHGTIDTKNLDDVITTVVVDLKSTAVNDDQGDITTGSTTMESTG